MSMGCVGSSSFTASDTLALDAPEVNGFLTHLAGRDHAGASTQNQALSALVFLYRRVRVDCRELLQAGGRERAADQASDVRCP